MNKKILIGLIVVGVVAIGAVSLSPSGRLFKGQTVLNEAPNEPIVPNWSDKFLQLPAKASWQDGGDSDNSPQKIRNYRWKISDENNGGKIVWERDWNDSDTGKISSEEKSCIGSIPNFPYAWTCPYVTIPEGILQRGGTYLFYVDAGDGQGSSGYNTMYLNIALAPLPKTNNPGVDTQVAPLVTPEALPKALPRQAPSKRF